MKPTLFLILTFCAALCISPASVAWAAADPQQNSTVPQFNGNFNEWLFSNLKFPQEALDDGVTGVCKFKFTINPQGGFSILMSGVDFAPHWAIEQEIVRVLRTSPKWTPAMKNGVPTKMSRSMKVDFSKLLDSAQLSKMVVVESKTYPKFDAWQNKKQISLDQWLNDNVAEPTVSLGDEKLNDTLKLSFVVNVDSTLSNIKVLNPRSDELTRIVADGFAKSKPWIPATFNGVPRRCTSVVYIVVRYDPRERRLQFKTPDTDVPYVIAEQMPKFKGGNLSEFRKWIMRQIQYPASAARERVQGRVIVMFVIERDGRLKGVQTISSPDERLTSEVLRILDISPKWTPGMQAGKVVRVKYTLPIDFRIP